MDFWEAPIRFPVCFMVGNEVVGLSEEPVALADLCLELPMMGVKQSLSVATAIGVLGYELARRHRKSFEFLVSGYASNIQYPKSSIEYQASSIEHRVQEAGTIDLSDCLQGLNWIIQNRELDSITGTDTISGFKDLVYCSIDSS